MNCGFSCCWCILHDRAWSLFLPRSALRHGLNLAVVQKHMASIRGNVEVSYHNASVLNRGYGFC